MRSPLEHEARLFENCPTAFWLEESHGEWQAKVEREEQEAREAMAFLSLLADGKSVYEAIHHMKANPEMRAIWP